MARKTSASGAQGGRPTVFSPELAEELCERLIAGESLRRICQDERMPGLRTVHRWLADGEHEDFLREYRAARELQGDLLAEEAVEIADDRAGDWITDAEGRQALDSEHVQRSRLRVDIRKWAAARMSPRRWGDRAALEVPGLDGAPIRTNSQLSLDADTKS